MLDIATQPSATSRWKNRPRPPAPEPLKSQPGPLKMFRILRTSPIEGLTSAHFQYPIVVSSTVIGKMTFVSCPKAIRHVLIDNSENYRRDRIQQRMVKLPFGQSLLAAEGDKWRNQRRWIRPAFSRESLSEAAQNMAAAAAMLVGRWQTFAAGSRLDISLEMHKAMMSLLERTLFLDGFGRDFEEMLRYLGREFDLTARIGLLDLLNVPAGVPRMVTVPLRPVLAFFARMTSDVIATRERRLAASPLTPPNDLVTVLLRAHGSRTHRALTKQEVASNIHLFFAAADEASANALCWVLYLLGLDPEWRERVEMEADRELPDGRYVEGSLERLVATRAVIEEALRLYPPVASINRQAIAADRLGEHSIKRGTYVIIAPWVVHRHCLLWDAPDLFDPSRFLPGARAAIDRFAYLPFGAGPRTCIGASFALQTLIIMLSTIVRSFRLEIDPEHKVWPVQHVTVHPKGGLPMILHRRQT